MVHAPSRAVALVFESVSQHEGGDAEGGAGPDFLHLLVSFDDSAVGGNAVDGAHFSLRELHHVEVEDLLQRLALHVHRDEITQAGDVGVPLSGELVGLDVVAVFASGVVAEILSVPELLDIVGLTFGEQIVILRLCG